MDPPNQRPNILRLPGPCNGRYELPTRADIDAAAVSPEYRQFLEETLARQQAPQRQTQSTAIRDDSDRIIQAILEAEAPPKPRKKRTFSGAYKVYSHTSPGPKQPVQQQDDVKQDINAIAYHKVMKFWFDTVSVADNSQTDISPRNAHNVPLEFMNAAIPRALAIANAAKEWQEKETLSSAEPDPVPTSGFNLFESLCTCPELIIEVGKHLKPKDIINLYSMSRNFHGIVDAHMQSTIKTWADHMAPGSVKMFSSDLYKNFYTRDPAGRPMDTAYYDMSHITIPERERQEVVNTEVRLVPGLKWLQMVYAREVRVRDIIATLARMGHRLAPGTDMVLKKLWLIMDLPTSESRMRLFRSKELITSPDLYRLQMFMVKLMLAFNDPIYGPESPMLSELMLGQRSLSALWAMLRRKKYTKRLEIRQLKVRYDIWPTPEQLMRGEPVHGVPVHEMGRAHREGWGTGNQHLLRPDELLYIESARRQLEFDEYIDKMMYYGHVDFESGAPCVPTLEEMYMSDDDLQETPNIEKHREVGTVTTKVYKECGNVPFERGMWTPRDIKKHHHWDSLSEEEKQAITREEKEEFSQTFDVRKWLFNFRYLERQLTNMLESVKTKDGRYDAQIVKPPKGKTNGGFDNEVFKIWGTPSGLVTALRSVTKLPFPYEPPVDYRPDWESETQISDQTHMQFALPGEDDLMLEDDDDLDGLDDDDFDYQVELDRVDALRQRLQDAQAGAGENEGAEEDDYEDEEMMDYDDDEYGEDDYDDDDYDDEGLPQVPGGHQLPQFAPQHQGFQGQGAFQQQHGVPQAQGQQQFAAQFPVQPRPPQAQGLQQLHQTMQNSIPYRTFQVPGAQQQPTFLNYPPGAAFLAQGGQQQPAPPQNPPSSIIQTQGGQQQPITFRFPAIQVQGGQQQPATPNNNPPGTMIQTQGGQRQLVLPHHPPPAAALFRAQGEQHRSITLFYPPGVGSQAQGAQSQQQQQGGTQNLQQPAQGTQTQGGQHRPITLFYPPGVAPQVQSALYQQQQQALQGLQPQEGQHRPIPLFYPPTVGPQAQEGQYQQQQQQQQQGVFQQPQAPQQTPRGPQTQGGHQQFQYQFPGNNHSVLPHRPNQDQNQGK